MARLRLPQSPVQGICSWFSEWTWQHPSESSNGNPISLVVLQVMSYKSYMRYIVPIVLAKELNQNYHQLPCLSTKHGTLRSCQGDELIIYGILWVNVAIMAVVNLVTCSYKLFFCPRCPCLFLQVCRAPQSSSWSSDRALSPVRICLARSSSDWSFLAAWGGAVRVWMTKSQQSRTHMTM